MTFFVPITSVPPQPKPDADHALWAAVGTWAGQRHTGTTKQVSAALNTWKTAKGL